MYMYEIKVKMSKSGEDCGQLCKLNQVWASFFFQVKNAMRGRQGGRPQKNHILREHVKKNLHSKRMSPQFGGGGGSTPLRRR